MTSLESSGPTYWLVWSVRGAWNALDFERLEHAEAFKISMEIKGGAVVAAKTKNIALRMVKPPKVVEPPPVPAEIGTAS